MPAFADLSLDLVYKAMERYASLQPRDPKFMEERLAAKCRERFVL